MKKITKKVKVSKRKTTLKEMNNQLQRQQRFVNGLVEVVSRLAKDNNEILKLKKELPDLLDMKHKLKETENFVSPEITNIKTALFNHIERYRLDKAKRVKDY